MRILNLRCCVAGVGLALGLVAACHPQPATVDTPSHTTTMENQSLTLHVGESREIQLASRGASGMQLLFSAQPEGLVDITRRDSTPQEREKTSPSIGDATPAYFRITGRQAGQATISFYEKPASGRTGPEIPVAAYQVTVTE